MEARLSGLDRSSIDLNVGSHLGCVSLPACLWTGAVLVGSVDRNRAGFTKISTSVRENGLFLLFEFSYRFTETLPGLGAIGKIQTRGRVVRRTAQSNPKVPPWGFELHSVSDECIVGGEDAEQAPGNWWRGRHSHTLVGAAAVTVTTSSLLASLTFQHYRIR